MSSLLANGARAARRRVRMLTLGELRFTARYGILAVYGIISVIYLLLLLWIDPAVRPLSGGVIILTDPAAMGLFFMGAMVLLEKSQQVNCALAVSPVRAGEYIAAKVLALGALGLLVALVVGAVAGNPPVGIVLSVALGSPLFTMLGMMVACRSKSLNQFLLLSVPVETVVFLPALFYWFGGVSSPLWLLTPGVAGIVLLGGDTGLWLPAALSLLVWDAGVYLLCRREVKAYFVRLGGGKL
jgi:fluoroquinolone transport system permease protein